MHTTDIHYTNSEGQPAVELSDVRSLLLDLALAQADEGDAGPMRLIAEERVRVAKVARLAEAVDDTDGELLHGVVDAARGLQAAQEAYGRALMSLEIWKEGEGF